jgi:hypothetical protein
MKNLQRNWWYSFHLNNPDGAVLDRWKLACLQTVRYARVSNANDAMQYSLPTQAIGPHTNWHTDRTQTETHVLWHHLSTAHQIWLALQTQSSYQRNVPSFVQWPADARLILLAPSQLVKQITFSRQRTFVDKQPEPCKEVIERSDSHAKRHQRPVNVQCLHGGLDATDECIQVACERTYVHTNVHTNVHTCSYVNTCHSVNECLFDLVYLYVGTRQIPIWGP